MWMVAITVCQSIWRFQDSLGPQELPGLSRARFPTSRPRKWISRRSPPAVEQVMPADQLSFAGLSRDAGLLRDLCRSGRSLALRLCYQRSIAGNQLRTRVATLDLQRFANFVKHMTSGYNIADRRTHQARERRLCVRGSAGAAPGAASTTGMISLERSWRMYNISTVDSGNLQHFSWHCGRACFSNQKDPRSAVVCRAQ